VAYAPAKGRRCDVFVSRCQSPLDEEMRQGPQMDLLAPAQYQASEIQLMPRIA